MLFRVATGAQQINVSTDGQTNVRTEQSFNQQLSVTQIILCNYPKSTFLWCMLTQIYLHTFTCKGRCKKSGSFGWYVPQIGLGPDHNLVKKLQLFFVFASFDPEAFKTCKKHLKTLEFTCSAQSRGVKNMPPS